MSIKTEVRVLKSWENPLYAKLDLDIFPTTEQTLEIETSLNRDNQDNGVLYSAELQALSEVRISNWITIKLFNQWLFK